MERRAFHRDWAICGLILLSISACSKSGPRAKQTPTVQASTAPTVSATATPDPVSGSSQGSSASTPVVAARGYGAVPGTGSVLGCHGSECLFYNVPPGEQLGCTSSICVAYKIPIGTQLGCTSSGCVAYRVPVGEQLGCTSSVCVAYNVPVGEQLACTSTVCIAYDVPVGEQLGCNGTSCIAYNVPAGEELGCNSSSCIAYKVPVGSQLRCGSSGCFSYTVSNTDLLSTASMIAATMNAASMSAASMNAASLDAANIEVAYGNPLNSDSTTNAYSSSSGTKDVDLQAAQLQEADLENRAEAIAQEFGMNEQSAIQVTELADKMHELTTGGKEMTPEDEAALLDSAYAAAGVSGEAVNAAAADYIKTGDESAVNLLLDQAAAHLGMSSAAGLRDEILPSIGIHLK